MLKLTNLISAFVCSLLLIACGGDGDNRLEEDSLKGTWTAVSLVGTVESTTTFSGQEIQSNMSFEDVNLSYDLTFDDNTFSTKGDYIVNVKAVADGEVVADVNSDVSDVTGSGNYTDSGTSITLDKPFFTLTFQGQEFTATEEEQTAEYEINSNGELIFSQDEIMEDNTSGIKTISKIVSTSVWKRK